MVAMERSLFPHDLWAPMQIEISKKITQLKNNDKLYASNMEN